MKLVPSKLFSFLQNETISLMEYQKLLSCPKISAAKEPSLQGTRWLGRIIHVVDADTFVIGKYAGDNLVRYTVRLMHLDSAEVKHLGESAAKTTPYEQALGALTKNYILQKLSPNQFKMSTEDIYGWQAQQKVFNKEAVIVMVDCPSVDSEGKRLDNDKYGRELGNVAILQDESDGSGWDVAQLLIQKRLVDPYEGKTKQRTFMTSTTFLDDLLDEIGHENVEHLKTLFAQLPDETPVVVDKPTEPTKRPVLKRQEIPREAVKVTTKTSLPEPRPKRIRRV